MLSYSRMQIYIGIIGGKMNSFELIEAIFVFAGGLGMFLYGMNMMGTDYKNLQGIS